MTYEVAVRAEATLGEGPTWDAAAGRLIWIDILGSRVHTYDPVSGVRTVRVTEQHVGAAKPRVGGGLVLNLRDGVGLVDPDGGSGGCTVSRSPGGGPMTRPSRPTGRCGWARCGTTRRRAGVVVAGCRGRFRPVDP